MTNVVEILLVASTDKKTDYLYHNQSPYQYILRKMGVKMILYQCLVCKHIFDESLAIPDDEGVLHCPVCHASIDHFQEVTASKAEPEAATQIVDNPEVASRTENAEDSLEYDKAYTRQDESCRYMNEIHQMSVSGETIIEGMGIKTVTPCWDEILILGAQLDPMPLEPSELVDTTTVLGKNALKPLVLSSPVYISHMSFGALSREVKIALAQGSAMAKVAMCSGEGGILPEEREAAYQYIFEYVPNRYSATPENLMAADAVEIKIGQGTKPGLGGHLPGAKVTPEIAAVRNKPEGKDIHSPSRFPGINSKEDMKELVAHLRSESKGRPIGIKIAAGRIEKDLAFCVYAEPDFITIDGRGGATAASPKLVRDSTSVPTIYALSRARKYLDSVGSDISLVITGGLRVSSDFAKALCMGADAVAIATSPILAAACQQYRICGSDQCPVGVATQDPKLRARLDIEKAAQRVANFFKVSHEELETYARMCGHSDLHNLSVDDLCTTSSEIASFTAIPHA